MSATLEQVDARFAAMGWTLIVGPDIFRADGLTEYQYIDGDVFVLSGFTRTSPSASAGVECGIADLASP